MISLGEASVGSVQLYAAGISKLLKLLPKRWDVLLTTDMVVRSERWGHIREQYERYGPAEYNPKQPWDSVIAGSAFGLFSSLLAAWWQSTFVLPNTLAATSSAAQNMIRDVEGMPASSSNQGGDRARKSRTPRRNNNITSESPSQYVPELEQQDRTLRS